VPPPTPYAVVRELLLSNLNMPADDVLKRAAARGVTVRREVVHNLRSELKKAAAKSGSVPVTSAPAKSGSVPVAPKPATPTPAKSGPVPVAAKPTTPAAKPPAAKPSAPAAKPAAPKPAAPAAKPATAPAAAFTGVLANVALVDKVAGLSGGIGNARQVAEAVRACGGVDAFLKHLELVAGIKKAGR
jgi:hypothetical protein